MAQYSQSDSRVDGPGQLGIAGDGPDRITSGAAPAGDSAEAHPRQHDPPAAASRHRRAVANTLEQADEAAAHGDYRGALSWLGLLDAIGDELPQAYLAKRQAWHTAVATEGHNSVLVFPAEPPQDALHLARELT